MTTDKFRSKSGYRVTDCGGSPDCCPTHAAASEMRRLLGDLEQLYERDARVTEYFRLAVSARALLQKIDA